jgi:probable HAF family extracellular repeat protein
VVELANPDGVSSVLPIEINRRGEVLGREPDLPPPRPGVRGVFWDRDHTDGTLIVSPSPSFGPYVVPRDLNDRGAVAGDVHPLPVPMCVPSHGAPVHRVGFTWQAGAWTFLDHQMAPCSFVSRVNDRGLVLGSQEAPTVDTVVAWRDGRVVAELDPLAGPSSVSADDLNDRDQALLTASPGSGAEVEITLLWQVGGGITDLGTLGGDRARGVDVNERGQVVGVSETATGEMHAFLWDGEMVDLGTLGGPTSYALAVNERAQVIGYSETAQGTTHAFVWEEGEMTDLGALPGPTDIAVALAINDRGQVVGTSNGRAFLWEDGEMTDLGALIPGAASSAVDVNNRGQVLGARSLPDGTTRVVVWNTR